MSAEALASAKNEALRAVDLTSYANKAGADVIKVSPGRIHITGNRDDRWRARWQAMEDRTLT